MNRFVAIAITSGLLITSVSGSNARQWKPSRVDEANEYLMIEHSKSAQEFVMLMWLAPAILDDTPENEAAREVTSQYTMIVVAHAEITPMLDWKFTEPLNVVIETSGGEIRQPISDSGVPILVSTIRNMLSQLIAQGLGAMGQNARTYLFDGQGITDCEEGIFWVHYAGERYEYETPVPGCE